MASITDTFIQKIAEFCEIDVDDYIEDSADEFIRILTLDEVDSFLPYSTDIDVKLDDRVLRLLIDFSVSPELCDLVSKCPLRIVKFEFCPQAKDVELLTYFPHLEYLVYGRSYIESFYIDLLPVLPRLSKLRHLELDMNARAFYDADDFLESLGKSILKQGKLESLYIGYTRATKKGLDHFLEIISKVSTWKRIVLDIDLDDGSTSEYLKRWKDIPVKYSNM